MHNIEKTVLRGKEPRRLQSKKRDFHHIKKRTLAVQRCFYFSDITYIKKVLAVSKTIIVCVFQTRKTFLYKLYQKNKNNVAQPKFSFLCCENLVS